MKQYFNLTSSLTYSFIASLPLFILYEILIRISQPDSEAVVRLSAEIWLSQLLFLIHENTLILSLGVLVILGGIIFYMDREKSIQLKPQYFMGIIAESTVWAFVLAVIISGFLGWLFMADGMSGSTTKLQMLALSIGAGLYEELVFRVILVYALIWFFSFFTDKKMAIVLSVLIAAAIFSFVHYIGSYGDTFTLASFLFRMIFGLALNALLVIRGFGITAWTHSLYDVMLVIFII